jgi:hypothetical protein
MTTRERPRRSAPSSIPFPSLILALAILTLAIVGWRAVSSGTSATRSGSNSAGGPGRLSTGAKPAAQYGSGAARGHPSPSPMPGPINTKFPGITTFRGNATRTYYGEGPVPRNPRVLWRAPDHPMCASSTDPSGTRQWCGTGWTGQPNVIQHTDGSLEVRVGAFDDHYHFWNGRTGTPARPDLVTGDLAKGSATSDSDGYPLYYGGSRDNLLRVIALDRPAPTVLWQVDANHSVQTPMWNDDWDGAPLQLGDYLLEGGENSWFYVIKLNRGYDAQHKVTVDPKIVMRVPGWDAQELRDIHDEDVSIENSVSFLDGVVYFANSGGLVQGWDISDILRGGTHYRRVFRFWTGDDTDASVVIDPEGNLYVASEIQRYDARSQQVGQIIKLDPSKPNDPEVWGVPVPEKGADHLAGSWSTPALANGMVYVSTNYGDLLGIKQSTGRVVWRVHLQGPTWASPVVLDGVLIEGDCAGRLHAFDVSDPRRTPKELWTVQLSGCIESTPAVWHGMIWVGARGGYFYGIGDAHRA